jgi:hypothetical protein
LPPGATSHNPAFVLNDFNGDGRSELVFFDAYLPYSSGASNMEASIFIIPGAL